MRVGIGFDAHPLVAGRPLILGGVEVPFEKGLQGHSDGDALVHAIVDALVGASSLGDIGTHFPSSDPRYQDVSSLLFLQETLALLQQRGWKLHNVDATIVAEAPRLQPHIGAMRSIIAQHLGVDVERVTVKAKTTDGLGFTGRGEGIAVYAVASLLEPA